MRRSLRKYVWRVLGGAGEESTLAAVTDCCWPVDLVAVCGRPPAGGSPGGIQVGSPWELSPFVLVVGWGWGVGALLPDLWVCVRWRGRRGGRFFDDSGMGYIAVLLYQTDYSSLSEMEVYSPGFLSALLWCEKTIIL